MATTETATKAVDAAALDKLRASQARLVRIEEKNAQRESAHLVMKDAQNSYKRAKNAYDELQGELDDLIQGKDVEFQPDLPFGEETTAEIARKTETPPLVIPEFIQGLAIGPPQQVALAEAGVTDRESLRTLHDGQWEQFPKGLADIKGIGPKALQAIRAALAESEPKELPTAEELQSAAAIAGGLVTVKVTCFHEVCESLQPGSIVSGMITDVGTLIYEPEGGDPIELQADEFELQYEAV